MMCFACEKIYAEDYICKPCSVRKKTKVLMEVVALGRVRCILCGKEDDAPDLTLETSMTRESIARIKQKSLSMLSRSSTGRNRAPGVNGSGGQHIRGPNENAQGSPGAFQPIISKARDSASVKFSTRPEPDLIESGETFIVVVEFPRHRHEDEIAWHIAQNTLCIESKIDDCPYRNQIKLPHFVHEPPAVHFQNGILEFVFDRKPRA